MIATVITTSLDGVWVPWFTERLKNREIKSINDLAVDYINLMTYAMVGVMLVGPEVVKLLASSKYWEGISIIPPVVLANYIIFAYTLYVNIEHYYSKHFDCGGFKFDFELHFYSFIWICGSCLYDAIFLSVSFCSSCTLRKKIRARCIPVEELCSATCSYFRSNDCFLSFYERVVYQMGWTLHLSVANVH